MKVAYWISTTVLCLVIGFSAYMYFFNYDNAAAFFTRLGFPTWMIYPSAIAKMLAIVAILTKLSNFLKEWAYAGIFFDVSMALTAHLMAQDGSGIIALVGFVAVVTSYYFDGQLFGNAAIKRVTGE